jgi:hypothetical protein
MVFTVVRLQETVPQVKLALPRRHVPRHAFTFNVRGEARFTWLLAAPACNRATRWF